MHGSRKFFQRGSNFDVFFFSWWRDWDQNTAISEPSSACQWNGVLLACLWWPNIECWFVVFRGSRPVLLRNPIFLWFFSGGGGGGGPVLPSGSTHVYSSFSANKVKKIHFIINGFVHVNSPLQSNVLTWLLHENLDFLLLLCYTTRKPTFWFDSNQ